jgi:uncharacterized protein (UPF0332 family)
MPDSRSRVIEYWLDRAGEAWDEAELLSTSAHWNGCVNRLYYACFYALTGLLVLRAQRANRHTAIRSVFNRDFVRTGIFSRELGTLYNTLFDIRQEADYTDLARFSGDEIQPLIPATRDFLQRVREVVVEQSVG